jgi:hypothetical protein
MYRIFFQCGSKMNTNIWLVVGIVILVLVLFNFRKSNFTIQPFDNNADITTTRENHRVQVDALLSEMKTALADSKTANKTVDERVAISNTYNDQLIQLSKNLSEWLIRHDVL